jgi:hypothetical protein
MPIDKDGIIRATDDVPLRVEVVTNGDPAQTLVRDVETKKPIDGITRIEFVLTPEGSELRLAFGPQCYKLIMQGEPVSALEHAPALLVDIKTKEPVSLKDGDQIVIATPEGTPQAVLTAQVVAADGVLPINPAAAEDPMTTQEMGTRRDDDERPPRRALGQREDV